MIIDRPSSPYAYQKSKFDKDASKIIELLDLGLSIRKIAKFFGYKNHISLNHLCE